MRKKSLVMAVAMAFVLAFSVFSFAEETSEVAGPKVSVGGIIKLTVFDRVNAISKNNSVQTGTERTYGVTFKELSLFLNAKINDWLSFEVDPKFSQSTGATPKLGVTYTAAASGFSFNSMSHGKAVMIVELPWDVHMEVGQIRPLFNVEYGKALFWEDEFNGGPYMLGKSAYHDSGIELMKTFSLTDDISMPVYLYYLNGGGSFDNNNQPGGMLHIEPSIGPLTILASVLGYKSDAKEMFDTFAYTAGLQFNWEGLQIRAEAMKIGTEKNGLDDREEGYFAKAVYKVLPWMNVFVLHESQLKIGDNRAFKNAFGSVIYLSDATLLQFEIDMQEQKKHDGSASIAWTRPSISVRSTF